MIKAFSFFIDKWRLSLSISIIALIAGSLGLKQMLKETFPPVNTGNVLITTIYPGSSADEVNENVSQVIEDKIRTVDGLKDVTTISQAGLSRIILQIDIDNYDVNDVEADIEEAIDKVATLPSGILNKPEVYQIKSTEIPIVKMALTGPENGRKRNTIAKYIKDRIEKINGVSRVDLEGYTDREIQILIDKAKLDLNQVGIQEISNAISTRVLDVPIGEITANGKTELIRLRGKVKDPYELNKLVIRSNFEGKTILLEDIAEVHDTSKDKSVEFYLNGQQGIGITLVKKSAEDSVELMKDVRPLIASIKDNLPSEYNLEIYDDEAKRIENILDIAVGNAIIGFILVTVFLLVFFPKSTGILTAMSLPIVIMITLGIMPIIGAGFNRVTLLAIIICLGLLVDNSIIIAENYINFRQQGLKPLAAAKAGVKQFWIPITATVLTTVAAFMPMLITKGIMGNFIKFIPIVVSIALIISLLESFILLPARLRFSMQGDIVVNSHSSSTYHIDNSWFGKIQLKFEKIVFKIIDNRYYCILGVVFLIAFSFFLQIKFNYFEVFPKKDVEAYFARFESSASTSLDNTLAQALQYEQQVKQVIAKAYGQDTITNSIITIGNTQDSSLDTYANYGDYVGSLRVIIPLSKARKIKAEDFINKLRQVKQDDFTSISWQAIAPGPPVGKPLEVTLSGANLAELEKAVAMLKAKLKNIKGVYDVTDDRAQLISEYTFAVNDKLLSGINLSYQDLGFVLRSSLEGNLVANLNLDGENVGIRIRNNKTDRNDINQILKTKVLDSKGYLIPVEDVARLQQGYNIPKITRYKYERAITVSADVDNKNMTSVELNRIAKELQVDISKELPEITFSALGQDESTKESVSSLLNAFFIAFMAIFLILLFLFDSFVLPGIILLSIPYGLVGVFTAFFLHGLPLSFFAIVGIVGLAGVVVNDTIILISFTQDLKQEAKLSGKELIARATSARLKPVLVTTLTTVSGLLPTAYAIGGHDASLIPLTLAMAWGVVSGTTLILVTTPALLQICDDMAIVWQKMLDRVIKNKIIPWIG